MMTICLLLLAALATTVPAAPAQPNPQEEQEEAARTFDRYRSLSSRFNVELAGRYPFGSPESAEVNPVTLRLFLSDCAPALAELRAALAPGKPGGWRNEARRFLAQMEQALPLLQALAAPTGALRVRVTFDQPRGRSGGTDQLVRWRFTAGDRHLDHPASEGRDAAPALVWSAGEPVAVNLHWADRSRFRPRPDPQAPDVAVDGAVAQVTLHGAWALLRLLERAADGAPPTDNDPFAGRVVVIDLPLTDSTAADGGTARVQAPLTLQLLAGAPGGAADRPLPISLPLPRRAPMPR